LSAAGGLIRLVDLDHLDAGLPEMPGQRSTVGAGALHAGPPQDPERARPAQQRVVAGSTGRERLGFSQHAQRGDDRCHVQILMGIDTENDFLGAAAVLVVSHRLGHAGHGRPSPDRQRNRWPSPDRRGRSEL